MYNISEIRVRDPFILPRRAENLYYLYGSTDLNVWNGTAVGFDCYTSRDLVNWEGPHAAFRPAADFWSDTNYWAPEVHEYKGRFYMLASFYTSDGSVKRGTQILSSDTPEGPFTPWSDGPVTPKDWMSLDGTLYVDETGAPWMVFCHEWVQIKDGTICAIPLTADLRAAAGEPVKLFSAKESGWADPVDGGNENYVTDGPFLWRDEDGLYMFWASFTKNGGYAEGIAKSATGLVTGPWEHLPPLFTRDGGHGMMFRALDGGLMFTLHRPNESPRERASFFRVEKKDGSFTVI